MSNVVKFNAVEERIITLRGTKVILDFDVALLYGVETKRINEAVKNNSDKFPEGYVLQTTDEEMKELRSKFSTTNMSRVNCKAFTEKRAVYAGNNLKKCTGYSNDHCHRRNIYEDTRIITHRFRVIRHEG
jgi:hypothetical protein